MGFSPFWNLYRGSDGRYLALGMLQDRRWPEICEAIGQPELEHDERFASRSARLVDHRQELIAILEEAFSQRPADEWLRRLSERGVFCARVQDYEELSHDPQVIANGYIVEVERPDGPPVRMVATPVQLSKTPTRIRGLAPELGQHTEEVLIEAGYSWEEIDALRGEGAIGPKQEDEPG